MRRLVPALLVTWACKGDPRPGYQPSGHKPEGATRTTPPPHIEAAALAVGARVPEIDLPATTGRLTWEGALANKERVLLMLYRGDW